MLFPQLIADLVRAVPAELAGAPTPCREWDVRTLTNHLRQVGAALRLAMRGEPVPGTLWQATADDPDFAGLTWADPPATVDMGGTVMPGRVVADMLVADLVLHGWDLSRAIHRPYPCPPEVAEIALAFVRATGEQARGMGLFGAPVPVPEDASALDRAVGLSGRDPRTAFVVPRV
jgi:uncharacterized protein (TIGR03086 family)